MRNWTATFLAEEDGAVTVDWVVLTASIIGLGMLVLIPIAYSTENTTQDIADYVADIPVGYATD